MRRKSLLALFLTLAMIMPMLNGFNFMASAEGEKFNFTLEFYEFTPDSTNEILNAGTIGGAVDPTMLEPGQYFAVAIRYNNLDALTTNSLRLISTKVNYSIDAFEPLYAKKINGSETLEDDGSVTITKATTDLNTNLISSYGYGIYELVTADVDSATAGMRTIKHNMAYNVAEVSEFGFVEPSAILAYYPFKAKKNTDTAKFEMIEDSGVFAYFNPGTTNANDSSGISGGTFAEMQAAGSFDLSSLPSEALNVQYISADPVIDVENDVTRTLTDGDVFDSNSKMVIKKLTKNNADVAIKADTVANIYKVDPPEVEGGDPVISATPLNADPIAAAGDEVNGYTITIPLTGYANTDFIVKTIENYGNDDLVGTESPTGKSIEMLALETDPPIIVDSNVVKSFGADGKLATGSLIKIENIGTSDADKQAVDSNTVIRIYEDAEKTTQVGNADGYTTIEGATEILVPLEGLEDKVYYLTATQGTDITNESQSAPLVYLLSWTPTDITVENNFYNDSETNSYIVVKNLQKGDTNDGTSATVRPVTENVQFNVYANTPGSGDVSDAPGSTAPTNMTNPVTPVKVVVPANGDIPEATFFKIPVPKATMTEDGIKVWISAKEADIAATDSTPEIIYIESTKIGIAAKAAGSTITDVVDPENPPTEDPDKTIYDGIMQDNDYKNPVVVPTGTKLTDLAAWGLTSVKVPVQFAPAIEVEGQNVTITSVTPEWNLDGLNDALGTEADADKLMNKGTYTVNVKAIEEVKVGNVPILLDAETLPEVTVTVVDKPEITLKDGNARQVDIDRGVAEAKTDIFTYASESGSSNSVMAINDPGFSVINSDKTTTNNGTLRMYYKVPKEGVEGEFDEVDITTPEELASLIELKKKTDFSKTTTIYYEYTDPTYEAIKSEPVSRNIYSIFKRGDFNRDGVIDILDLQILKSEINEFTPRLDISDVLYRKQTAFVSTELNFSRMEFDIRDYQDLKNHQNEFIDLSTFGGSKGRADFDFDTNGMKMPVPEAPTES